MGVLIVLAGLLGVVVLAGAISYNRFVTQRNHVRESWSNVDTELRRRYDLIPNLVETVKGYAAHERAVLEAVTQARTNAVADLGPPGHQAQTEAVLVDGVRRLLAVAESYPDLKASGQFLALQQALTDTEDRIQLARRIYNANVRDLNRRVQSVPSNIVASMFGFREAEYFEVEEAIRRSGAPAV